MRWVGLFVLAVLAVCQSRHVLERPRYPHGVPRPPYPSDYLYLNDPFYNDPYGLLYPQYPLPALPTFPTAPPTTTTTTTTTTARPTVVIIPGGLSASDDLQATNIGVRVPPDSCVITWEQYQQNIPARNWIGIYSIDDDEQLNPGVAYKFHVLWTVVNDTTTRRQGSLWDNITKKCLFADGFFTRETSTGRAIFRSAGGNIFANPNRKDYFVSSDPANYVIFYICYDTDKIRDGRCITSEIILVVRDQRQQPTNGNGVPTGEIKLNDIPWTKIEADFRNCLGQEFVDSTDPQINWVWENPECPVPGTQAFQSGIGAQNG